VFGVLGLVLLSVAGGLLSPSLEEFEREGVGPAVTRIHRAIVVAGFLAAVPAGFLAARVAMRHRKSLAAVVLAAAGPPFVLGAIYLLGYGFEAGLLLAGLVGCPVGALIGLGFARGRAQRDQGSTR